MRYLENMYDTLGLRGCVGHTVIYSSIRRSIILYYEEIKCQEPQSSGAQPSYPENLMKVLSDRYPLRV